MPKVASITNVTNTYNRRPRRVLKPRSIRHTAVPDRTLRRTTNRVVRHFPSASNARAGPRALKTASRTNHATPLEPVKNYSSPRQHPVVSFRRKLVFRLLLLDKSGAVFAYLNVAAASTPPPARVPTRPPQNSGERRSSCTVLRMYRCGPTTVCCTEAGGSM
jgi:hypothetical protein